MNNTLKIFCEERVVFMHNEAEVAIDSSSSNYQDELKSLSLFQHKFTQNELFKLKERFENPAEEMSTFNDRLSALQKLVEENSSNNEEKKEAVDVIKNFLDNKNKNQKDNFDAFDTNSDGVFEKEEFNKAMHYLRKELSMRFDKKIKMFELPNKPKISPKDFEKRERNINEQYEIAVKKESRRLSMNPEIKSDAVLKIELEIEDEIDNIVSKGSDDVEIFDQMSALLARYPSKYATIFLMKMWSIPRSKRVDMATLLLDRSPKESALWLVKNIHEFPESARERIASLLLGVDIKGVEQELAKNIYDFPELIQEKIIHLLLDRAPQESALAIANNISLYAGGNKNILISLVSESLPRKNITEFVENMNGFSKDETTKVLDILIKKHPQEVVLGLFKKSVWLNKKEDKIKIINPLFKKYPKEFISIFTGNFKALREVNDKKIVGIVMNQLKMAELNFLIEAEKKNSTLYDNTKDSLYFRQQFQKDGSETFLLGKDLTNNAILRIIPNSAFVAWFEAYKAVDVWEKAGFDYVPIEPILKAQLSKDGENTRVYAGVVGAPVSKYLNMKSTQQYHENIEQQIISIQEVLISIGINHGHLHYDNFCILHERTDSGEIDWDKPPRVYCIDFDEAISS